MSTPRPSLAIVATLAACVPFAVVGQDVQRCESPDGRAIYAQGDCPAGTSAVRALPPAGAPSASDRRAAEQRAHQDARSATALERTRKAEEERQAKTSEQALAKAKKQEALCRRLETRLRLAQQELADARPGKSAEAQRRVRRAEANYVDECGPVKN
jgi:hypothetical protein